MIQSALSIRFAELEDLNTIGFLAQQIWPATYKDILQEEQLLYMMELFYSPASLKKQLTEEKHSVIIIENAEEAVGFASYSPLSEAGIFKLHKLYVLPNQQGKGLGKTILDFITSDIRTKSATALRLNVNRYNKARNFYERLGFKIIAEEDINIGNNYYMNDYIMELKIS
jgi:ribosomal protein S18 acetylase RimI-like enzyme